MERNTKKILGHNVDILTFDNALLKVMDNIEQAKGMQIVTVNPEMIELADKNKEFADILDNAELVIPDGSGIKLALKLKGIVQEQIPGIDFSKELLKCCGKKNYKIAFIGAKEEVINKAVENIKKEIPNVNICYYRNGYFNAEEENQIITYIKENGAKLILSALGAPKQEIFNKKCREQIKDAVFIGVGGSFDVWAGNVERAPEIYRKFGCEWIYRTLKQPQRIKRIYKTLPMFLIKVIIEAMKEK